MMARTMIDVVGLPLNYDGALGNGTYVHQELM
jgi:hypothetical protein